MESGVSWRNEIEASALSTAFPQSSLPQIDASDPLVGHWTVRIGGRRPPEGRFSVW